MSQFRIPRHTDALHRDRSRSPRRDRSRSPDRNDNWLNASERKVVEFITDGFTKSVNYKDPKILAMFHRKTSFDLERYDAHIRRKNTVKKTNDELVRQKNQLAADVVKLRDELEKRKDELEKRKDELEKRKDELEKRDVELAKLKVDFKTETDRLRKSRDEVFHNQKQYYENKLQAQNNELEVLRKKISEFEKKAEEDAINILSQKKQEADQAEVDEIEEIFPDSDVDEESETEYEPSETEQEPQPKRKRKRSPSTAPNNLCGIPYTQYSKYSNAERTRLAMRDFEQKVNQLIKSDPSCNVNDYRIRKLMSPNKKFFDYDHAHRFLAQKLNIAPSLRPSA
jgi:chromosome segregation ATPase